MCVGDLSESQRMLPALNYHIETVSIAGQSLRLAVPDQEEIASRYLAEPVQQRAAGFWAKIWPSALALVEFMFANPTWINNKALCELGAGLGLPSLWAAATAGSVCCTDQSQEAVALVETSARLNDIGNLRAMTWNWNEPATLPPADLWLLSDGNYDADNNIQLLNFLLNQLEKGSSLLLTTPGRLTGQAFLTALLPYCRQREQYGEDSPVFAFAFQK